MRRHIAYLKYVLRHKYYVWWAGRQYFPDKLSHWQLLKHDLSKFRLSEWFPYARTFYKPNGEKQYDPQPSFGYAWAAHIRRNPHHYQHWVLHYDSGETKCLDMPEKYVYEMIADWMGAGMAMGLSDKLNAMDEARRWYVNNYDTKLFSDDTRSLVDSVLLGGDAKDLWLSTYALSDDITDYGKAVRELVTQAYSIFKDKINE